MNQALGANASALAGLTVGIINDVMPNTGLTWVSIPEQAIHRVQAQAIYAPTAAHY